MKSLHDKLRYTYYVTPKQLGISEKIYNTRVGRLYLIDTLVFNFARLTTLLRGTLKNEITRHEN
jgi:hypothetical protein